MACPVVGSFGVVGSGTSSPVRRRKWQVICATVPTRSAAEVQYPPPFSCILAVVPSLENQVGEPASIRLVAFQISCAFLMLSCLHRSLASCSLFFCSSGVALTSCTTITLMHLL